RNAGDQGDHRREARATLSASDHYSTALAARERRPPAVPFLPEFGRRSGEPMVGATLDQGHGGTRCVQLGWTQRGCWYWNGLDGNNFSGVSDASAENELTCGDKKVLDSSVRLT